MFTTNQLCSAAAVEAVLMVNQSRDLQGLSPSQAVGLFAYINAKRIAHYGIKTAADPVVASVDFLIALGAVVDRDTAINYAEARTNDHACRPLTRPQAVAMFGPAVVDCLDSINVEYLTTEDRHNIYMASIMTADETRLQVRVAVAVEAVDAVEDLDDLNWSEIFANTAIYLTF